MAMILVSMVQDTQSTSRANIVVLLCFFAHHDMALPLRLKACPEVDLDSSKSLPQSIFEYPLNSRPLP